VRETKQKGDAVMEKKTIVNAALAGTLGLGLTAAGPAAGADKKDMEKCYGIAKAGKNDCGSKYTKHACAGQSKVDGHPGDWILVQEGNCKKIVGGSLKPHAKKEDNGESQNGS